MHNHEHFPCDPHSEEIFEHGVCPIDKAPSLETAVAYIVPRFMQLPKPPHG